MRVFAELLKSISQVTPLCFELWDRRGALLPSEALERKDGRSPEVEALVRRVMSEGVFQSLLLEGGGGVFAVPVRSGEEVVGALLSYSTAGPEGDAGHVEAFHRNMEIFLAQASSLMEDRMTAQQETQKMAEELTRSFEDLYLYSTISTQVKSLQFSNMMLRDLIRDLLETMHSDLAFALMPHREEYYATCFTRDFALRVADADTFARSLVERIPVDATSLREYYFIVNDSRENETYGSLHPDPYRFLAVMIQHEQHFYGWLGLLSFNLEEIFRRGELRLLISVASSTATAIENTRLYNESVDMARKERFIRNIFQKYVPEEVANRIIDLGERDLITLGEKRLVTLLNVDIRGYSLMTKKIKAETVVEVLNYFFKSMGTVVLKHKGILDKYLGDGLLAIFGAPIERDNPALDATLAALEMVRTMASVNEFVQERYGIPLSIGVSINTGEAIMGNIGFEKKMDYTVIGDVVNDTFRLQEITREKPNSVLISHSTYDMIKSHVRTRFVGLRSLGAGEDRVEIYEVTDVA